MTDDLEALVAEVNAPDFFNPAFARLHALHKDTPAKWWNEAAAMHPAIFRALRLDQKDEGAIFAAMPFRLQRTEEGARILVALPAPRFFDADSDHLDIETVLAWHPDTGAVYSLTGETDFAGDRPDLEAPLHIYGSAFTFFRALAEERARWIVSFYAVADTAWKRRPEEPRLIPGLLLLGDEDKVRWPTRHQSIELHGLNPAKVNKAILRQSTLPRAVAAYQMRAVA